MAKYYVVDIDWDAEEEDKDLLPKETLIEAEDEEEIADKLSDKYGWLINSYSACFVPKKLPAKISAFSEVAPVYTAGGVYVTFGKATADDGVIYPFIADMSDNTVALLNVCPYDLPEDEQEMVWDYFEWQKEHIVAEFGGKDVTGFMIALCDYILENDDEVFRHSWSNYSVAEIQQLRDNYKPETKETTVSYEQLLRMFTDYVINDTETAELDYVREALEKVGCDEKVAKAIGLDWLFGDDSEYAEDDYEGYDGEGDELYEDE